jgi:hypothetical protein
LASSVPLHNGRARASMGLERARLIESG